MSSHGHDGNSRQTLLPTGQSPSQAWYLTSGLAYTHDRANFKAYWILDTPLTLAPTSEVAQPGIEIRIHGIGTVEMLAWRPFTERPNVIIMNNVLHWPDVPCNGFNPRLNGNEGFGRKFEISPTYAKGWERGWAHHVEAWTARQEHENCRVSLVLSGARGEEKGVPRWMARDIYLTEEDRVALGIRWNIPGSLEPQAQLDYTLAAKWIGEKTRIVKETVLIDGQEVDVTWDESSSEEEIAWCPDVMTDVFEAEGVVYEVDFVLPIFEV